jgi:Tfp pilus assembly protein PilV
MMKLLILRFKSKLNSNKGMTMVEVLISFVIFMLSLVMVTMALQYAITTQQRYSERKEWINMLLINMYAEKSKDIADVGTYDAAGTNFKLTLQSTDVCFSSMASECANVNVKAYQTAWAVKFNQRATEAAFGLILDEKIKQYDWYSSLTDGDNIKFYDPYVSDGNADVVFIPAYKPMS